MRKELYYGEVLVKKGRHKGRIGYYDDDLDSKNKRAIVYLGDYFISPKYILVPYSHLTYPNINELMERRDEIRMKIFKFHTGILEEDIDEDELISLYSELNYVTEVFLERFVEERYEKVTGNREAFLCHSSADKAIVRRINNDLRNLSVKTWLDELEISAGDSIIEQINDALDDIPVLIAFLSKDSVKSKWVKREWQSMLSKQLNNKNVKIVPALITECEIPSIISDIKYADFRDSYSDGLETLLDVFRVK